MSRWTKSYTHGTLIDFEFLKELGLSEQVQQICREKGWQYDEIPGDMSLFRRLLDGEWEDFLVVQPGQKVAASFDERVMVAV